ncbi:hypothetical protein C491_18374 [Natronococcus amylolyticus DSM 10524]|uniref:Uncharacterized protein n=1 Tax=Natronococcus amylolyticus DSM 10524 TaxID=1227497 RepID=L9WYN4_9EURY|nr:hypothetical protein [Natronococcus amylolyticus]ELY54595.1 hypothetical protein C491_18374 [Natronococcus amylolyticus DSM 10524]
MSPRARPTVLEFVSTSEPWLPAWLRFGSILENTPLSTVGGSPTVIALVFLSLVLATLLSVYLALRLYRGYRAGGGRAMLLLGVGLVLLTTVPLLLRLALSNVGGVAIVWQETIVTACQLLGLVVILGVIHGRR